jgi:hypothetical protein
MQEFQEGVGNLATLGSSEVRRAGGGGVNFPLIAFSLVVIGLLIQLMKHAAYGYNHYAYGQVGWAKRRRRMMTIDQDVENEPEWNVPE